MDRPERSALLSEVRRRMWDYEVKLRAASARIDLLPDGEQKKAAALERVAIEQGADFLRDWEKKLMKAVKNKRRHRAIDKSSKQEACHG